MRRAARRARRRAGHALRLGRTSTRSRRRDLHRPARPRGRRAGGLPSAGCRRGACRRPASRRRGRRAHHGSRADPTRGHAEPRARHRRRGGGRRDPRGAERVRDPAVPHRGPHRGRRGPAPALPLPRPASARDDEGARDACAHRAPDAGAHGRARVRRGRDADAHAVHPGGLARLPGAEPAVAGHLLRPAAVAAAAEAAAHDRRAGPLLPDRAVPARRGRPRRPRLRVHPARRGDVVRRRGRPDRPDRAAVRPHRARGRRRRRRRAVPDGSPTPR